MLNAIMHVIVEEELYDQQYIDAYTENWEAEKAHLKDFTPEAMAEICGIEPRRLRDVARTFAGRQGGDDLLGHGHQPAHPRHRQFALPDLAGADDRSGRASRRRAASAARPEQRAGCVGCGADSDVPAGLPERSPTTACAPPSPRSGEASDFSNEKGLTVTEIMDAVHAGDIKGMYILGENPAMSDPDVEHARDALAKLDHLVVQDIFITETANYADVILPASAFAEKSGTVTNTNRQVQMGRPRGAAARRGTRGLVDQVELAKRLGLDWTYDRPARDVFAEMKLNMNSLNNITWDRLESGECGDLSVAVARRSGPGRSSSAMAFRGQTGARGSPRPASSRRTRRRMRTIR